MVGRSDLMTTKSLSKKMKAKGLMKLRFYCQMCQKQCRDANGFKCHCMSDAHQRQMEIFAENSTLFLTSFSQQFQSDFMSILKQHYPNKQVLANSVYQDYITDPNHVHMNSTKWDTLTTFVQYLQEKDLVHVEETDRGLFITYESKDSQAILSEASKKKTGKLDNFDEKAEQRALQRQIDAGRLLEMRRKRATPTDLDLMAERNVGFVIQAKRDSKIKKSEHVFEVGESKKSATKTENMASSAVLDILREEDEQRDSRNRKDYWLSENLIVKVVSPKYKCVGEKVLVKKVVDLYEAEVETEDGEVMRMSQEDVETVIPRIGGTVKVVNGAHRHSHALLEASEDFTCKIRITTGPFTGFDVCGVRYDDICKVFE